MGTSQSSSPPDSSHSRSLNSRGGNSRGSNSRGSNSRDSQSSQIKQTRKNRFLKSKKTPTTSTGTFGSVLEGTSLSGLSARAIGDEGPLTSGGTLASEITEGDENEAESGPLPSGSSLPARPDADVPTTPRKSPSSERRSEFQVECSGAQPDMKSLEADRQTRLHQLLKFVLKTNSFVPLSNPTNILDCGCGVGIWSLDMGQTYKGCNSIGLDICPPTDIVLPNFYKNINYLAGDINKPLKFEDNIFDLINQRDMTLYVEPKRWVQALTEYERIIKPGGWVQLVEGDVYFNCDHPAVHALNNLFKRAVENLVIDPFVCNRMDQLTKQAGFVNVTKRVLEIPVGEWDKREGFAHIGFISRNLAKTSLKCFKSYLMKVNNITGDQYDKICAGALGACETNKGFKTFVVVCGQKKAVE